MAKITAQNQLVDTFTAEFDSNLYFRVEMFRVDTGEPGVQTVTYFAEVYQLKWPLSMFPQQPKRTDTRFGQYWSFLEDFPHSTGSSPNQLQDDLLVKLTEYATAYSRDYDLKTKRFQPVRREG